MQNSENISDTAAVIKERRGHLGCVTLNKPKRLNAVDPTMAREIDNALEDFCQDDSVSAILLHSGSSRAFCAGGDIRHIREVLLREGAGAACAEMSIAYSTMLRISMCPKPVITIMDGITMGGGIGIGAHAAFRVVTERSVLAMPETAIGLTPDAGGSWLLARAPGRHGLRCAVTGRRIHGAEAVSMGLADVCISSADLPELLLELETCSPSDIARLHPDNIPPLPHDEEISAVWEGIDVERIRERLCATDADWAREDLALLDAACPWATGISAWSWRHARGYTSLDEALREETKLVRLCLDRPDFAEGIRARVIDKNTPHWSPATLEEACLELAGQGFV